MDSGGSATERHYHGVKRRFSQMDRHSRSVSPLFVTAGSTPSREPSPRRRHLRLPPLEPSIRNHYPGDGFDFRRPVNSRTGQLGNIIDLTDENETLSNHTTPPPPSRGAAAGSSRAQRLPRFERNIIDLSADTSSPQGGEETESPPSFRSSRRLPQSHMAANRSAAGNIEASPEVEFVSVRPRSQNTTRTATPAGIDAGPAEHLMTYHDLTTEDNDTDEVEYVRTEERPGLNLQPPQGTGTVRTRYMEQYAEVARILDATGPGAHGRRFPGRLLQRLGLTFQDPDYDTDLALLEVEGPPGPRGFQAPIMDYGLPGFAFDHGDAPRPPTPRYDPPSAAAAGFTRSPGESEVVVCPNCGDELATGDSEEKRQVWIVKNCAHVYCGTCMLHRQRRAPRAKSAKGKGRAMDEATASKAFSTCVVPGCSGKVSAKQILQVFF